MSEMQPPKTSPKSFQNLLGLWDLRRALWICGKTEGFFTVFIPDIIADVLFAACLLFLEFGFWVLDS